MANGLYKNIIQRLPAALLLVGCIFVILYLQNIYLVLTIVIAVGFLLIKEWLLLSESKIDLKQIIFFVTLALFSIFFTKDFIDLFLIIIAGFWVIYSFHLLSSRSLTLVSFDNNYLGVLLVLGFFYGLMHLLIFSEFYNVNKFFVLFIILFNII